MCMMMLRVMSRVVIWESMSYKKEWTQISKYRYQRSSMWQTPMSRENLWLWNVGHLDLIEGRFVLRCQHVSFAVVQLTIVHLVSRQEVTRGAAMKYESLWADLEKIAALCELLQLSVNCQVNQIHAVCQSLPVSCRSVCKINLMNKNVRALSNSCARANINKSISMKWLTMT